MIHSVKEIIFATLILIITGCQNKVNNPQYNTLLGQDQREFAQNLSVKILTAQKEGGFYKLNNNEASLSMVNAFTESVQKNAYEQIKSLFGEYEDLNFHSVLSITSDDAYDIYRFKGVFAFDLDVEVRVVLNGDDKLAGFFVKPWKETL